MLCIWGCARNGGGLPSKREREREREWWDDEGRDKAGNLSGRFSPGQEMHSYMGTKEQQQQPAHTCTYTPEAPLGILLRLKIYTLFFFLFSCVLLAFSEKKNLQKIKRFFSLSNNKGADKVLGHEANKNGRNPDRRKPAI